MDLLKEVKEVKSTVRRKINSVLLVSIRLSEPPSIKLASNPEKYWWFFFCFQSLTAKKCLHVVCYAVVFSL